MPWYGYLLSGLLVYVMGFISGRSAGISEVLQKTMQPSSPAGMPDMAALLKGIPAGPSGSR